MVIERFLLLSNKVGTWEISFISNVECCQMLYPAEFGQDALFPKSSDFAVIHDSDNTGFGVITYRAFKRGEIIAKMSGHVVPDIRQHTLQISSTEHNHDPYFSGFFLHSCSPNISLDMKNMTITALKNIPANSLLFMDYAETEDYLFKQFPCSCGSKNCREWIRGRLEAPAIQEEYKHSTVSRTKRAQIMQEA